MSRSAASAAWTVLGVVAAVLLALALVFGPRLYREGREMVGPMVDLARAEEAVKALDREMPWSPPPDGRIAPDRLEVFLAVRRDLRPFYERFEVLEKALEGRREQGWREAREALGVVREVFQAQVEGLRRRGMAPAEFRWLEEQVYGRWLSAVTRLEAADADRRLRRATAEDLALIAELRRRHGGSAALDELEKRLDERARSLAVAEVEPLEELGPNQALLAARRDEIAELSFERFAELHNRLRRGGSESVSIRIGEEPPEAVVVESLAPESTPAAAE